MYISQVLKTLWKMCLSQMNPKWNFSATIHKVIFAAETSVWIHYPLSETWLWQLHHACLLFFRFNWGFCRVGLNNKLFQILFSILP